MASAIAASKLLQNAQQGSKAYIRSAVGCSKNVATLQDLHEQKIVEGSDNIMVTL